MSSRRRLLGCGLLVALVAAGGALAGRGDPQERLATSDNARARAIVVRISDLGPGFKAAPSGFRGDERYCRALDESDLVITGKAVSPDFGFGLVGIGSQADIYESRADASASWRRLTSAAGGACLRRSAEIALRGARILSFARLQLPRIGQPSLAYRLVWEGRGVRVFSDLVFVRHGRARVSITFASAGKPLARSEVRRVARAVAGRMKTAMRGA